MMNKRQIFKVIFGRENVSNEELWRAGYGDAGSKIEVVPENISNYMQYKRQFLSKTTLKGIKPISTRWVELPKEQSKQIDVVMKTIAYAVLSLDHTVTMHNMSKTTLRFLYRLGFGVWGDCRSIWIGINSNAYKPYLDEEHLTAEKAKKTVDFINVTILQNYLVQKKKEQLQFIIIPTDSIPVEATNNNDLANDILENLGVEFDSDTLIKFYGAQPLTFIDLRNFKIVEEMQLPDLEVFKKYLTK